MTDFSVDFVGLTDFESLSAEISYKSQILCLIDKERDDGALEIEFFHEARILTDSVKMKFPVQDFIAVIEQTCADLREIPS